MVFDPRRFRIRREDQSRKTNEVCNLSSFFFLFTYFSFDRYVGEKGVLVERWITDKGGSPVRGEERRERCKGGGVRRKKVKVIWMVIL